MRGRFGAPSNVGPVVPPDRRANRAERSTRRGVWLHLRAGSPSNSAAACGRRAAAQVRCVVACVAAGVCGSSRCGGGTTSHPPWRGRIRPRCCSDARYLRCPRAALRANSGRARVSRLAHAGIPVDPGCADHCGVDALRAIGQRQPPAPVRLLVDAQHGGVELDLFAQTEGGGEAAQIGQDLPMRRVVGLMARHGMADECR